MTELQRRFSSHEPSASQILSMEEIRLATMGLADLIERSTPPGRERAEAVKHCELVMFWGNAGVVRPKAW